MRCVNEKFKDSKTRERATLILSCQGAYGHPPPSCDTCTAAIQCARSLRCSPVPHSRLSSLSQSCCLRRAAFFPLYQAVTGHYGSYRIISLSLIRILPHLGALGHRLLSLYCFSLMRSTLAHRTALRVQCSEQSWLCRNTRPPSSVIDYPIRTIQALLWEGPCLRPDDFTSSPVHL